MARIPIGMEYSSKIEGSLDLLYVCQSCGLQSNAQVRSKGAGEATAVAFINTRGAKTRARTEADANLVRNGELLLSQAPCPSCSFVDTSAGKAVQHHAMGKAALIVVVGIAIFFITPSRTSSLLALAPVVACVAAFIDYQRSAWRWLEVSERVQFVGKPKAATEPKLDKRSDYKIGFVWGPELADAPVSWPFHKGLNLGLLRAEDDGLEWLEPGDLDELGREAAKKRALKNLKAASAGGLVEVGPGTYRGKWKDGLAATRLAVPHMFSKLSLEGEAIAFTASEDTLFIAGSKDLRGLERAFALSKADLNRVIDDAASSAGRFTAHPWVLANGGWEPGLVPEGHALREPIAALDRELSDRGWRP